MIEEKYIYRISFDNKTGIQYIKFPIIHEKNGSMYYDPINNVGGYGMTRLVHETELYSDLNMLKLNDIENELRACEMHTLYPLTEEREKEIREICGKHLALESIYSKLMTLSREMDVLTELYKRYINEVHNLVNTFGNYIHDDEEWVKLDNKAAESIDAFIEVLEKYGNMRGDK